MVLAREKTDLSMAEAWKTWLPLAASWVLMGAELPMLSAVVARLADPEINLAAYGGVVFPIALTIEAPIIQLLAASTALSRDWVSYQKLRRFMLRAGAVLTAVHILVAFTPLYDFVARQLIGAPEETIEPGRVGLMLMTPWTWAIAYRRFNQGVLIRFGHSNAVGLGTLIRLLSGGIVLAIGYWIGTLPGVMVCTAAVSTAVLAEAFYVWVQVRPVLREEVRSAVVPDPGLTTRAFVEFYMPLALTAQISLLVQPLLTGAMSRMPNAVASLAVWPALNGLIFMIRALGLAYNEVVIALLGRPRGYQTLGRFTGMLTGGICLLTVLLVTTPLAELWFATVSGLKPSLVALGKVALWAALLTPGISVLQSWYQGILVYGRKTRPVTESVALFLVVSAVALIGGVYWDKLAGLTAGLLALTMGGLCQLGWQWTRSADIRRQLGQGFPQTSRPVGVVPAGEGP